MPTTKKRIKKPVPAPSSEVINVRISRAAYDIVTQEAKLTRRTFIVTLNMILGA